MPPKKASKDQGPSKKNVEKVKAKVLEDKTFGLKNKKGKKQQTYIKTVAHQVQHGNNKDANKTAAPKLTKRELEKQKLDELNALFKPVQQTQKVADGVDPKSVLCNYFKLGTCQKGQKCKFSHDLAVERKSEKRSMYTDEREGSKDTMTDWDQETLEEVVNKKHAASNPANTSIVCKFFLEAIEKSLYGWFWNCPNGDKCMYKHALPPGFVLKKDKNEEEAQEKISLEEHIELERNQLSGELTPVTIQTFLAWKKRKIEEKKEKLVKEMSQKKEAFKAGKSLMKISGKEVFLFKPELADDDDDEADDDFSSYRRDLEDGAEDDGPCVEINLEQFASTTSNDSSNSNITRVSTLSAKDRDTAGAPTSASYDHDQQNNNTSEIDVNGLSEASGSSDQANVVIDESLFEDLDELDIDDD